jgi:hypothetical protein
MPRRLNHIAYTSLITTANGRRIEVPYDQYGTWLSPEDLQGREVCDCSGCGEWRRTRGISPAEEYASQFTEPVYDAEGYDQRGYNQFNRDRNGYDRAGLDETGYNGYGYDYNGYDREGYNDEGYNREGRNRSGYDYSGYNREGRNRDGYDYDGYDRSGFTREGYDRAGCNREGYDRHGRDIDGYNRAGYDAAGYNRRGLDRYGNERPCDCTDCLTSRGELPPMVREVSPETRRLVERSNPHRVDPDDDPWFENLDGAIYHGRDDLANYDDDPDEDYREDVLRSYSYTPNLIFRRSHGENKKTTPYFGMEIEMTSRLSHNEMEIIRVLGMEDRLMYPKRDGSVAGFELVTHPMTAKWAAENFPWDIVEMLKDAGSSVIKAENGLHVHVSRAGFKDEAHMFRWMKLWYRNPEEIVRIAGRDGGGWGSFDPEQRKVTGRHAKAHAKKRHSRGAQMIRGNDTGPRYVALNLTNDATIEVRIFAATTSARQLRSRFELVSSSVEYTRGMTVKDTIKGGWNWDAYMLWLDMHSDDYPELARHETAQILEAIANREASSTQPLLLS